MLAVIVRRILDVRRMAWKALRVALVPAYWPGLRRGVAASIEHTGIGFSCQFASVIDVGANRGQFTLFAARRFPGARIWAFEPQPAAAETFLKVTAGTTGVTLEPVALGASEGRSTILIAKEDDSSSLLPLAPEFRTIPAFREVGRVGVAMKTLDGVLLGRSVLRPCLLKIDVQGSELEVLRGAANVLESVDEVLVEVALVPQYVGQPPAGEVLSLLQQSGFELSDIGDMTRNRAGRCLWVDLLFTRRRS